MKFEMCAPAKRVDELYQNLELGANLQADSILKNMIIHKIWARKIQNCGYMKFYFFKLPAEKGWKV